MNILFFIGEYPNFGGTERVTTVLANAFVSRGDAVHIVSFKQSAGRNLDIGLDQRVQLHFLHLPVNCKENSVAFRKVLVENKIEVIFNQWCWPFYTAWFINKARKGLGIKLLAINHGVPDKCHALVVIREVAKKTTGLKRMVASVKAIFVSCVVHASIRYVYRVSDAYVVLSKGFERVFKDYTGIRNPVKLHSIANPITVKTNYSTAYFADKKKQILFVGRMDKYSKRVDRIVDVWAELSKRYLDWNLVLVGGGPHLAELRDDVRRRGIERISFTGFVQDDPLDYYRESQIFMLTSDLEGFGLVIIEAMSYGVVPVVYGSYVSIYEILAHGKDGFITSMPYSHEETVNIVAQLIENNEWRRQMAHAAQEKSLKFSLDSTVARWDELIASLK